MSQKSFTYNGVEYDLSHLSPFTIDVQHKDAAFAPVRILVTFSHHVFSTRWVDGCDPLSAVTEDHEQRSFCTQRYGWSKDLQSAVRYYASGKAFEGRDGKGNWNHFFRDERNQRSVPYVIYFRLGKATKVSGADAILHVISAYENANMPAKHRFQSINFALLVDKRIGFKKAETK